MRVEFLADGTVGKVQVLNQLGAGLDENAVAAARKAVFLPAVKDGKFISFRYAGPDVVQCLLVMDPGAVARCSSPTVKEGSVPQADSSG